MTARPRRHREMSCNCRRKFKQWRACGLFALGLKSAGGVLYSPGAAGTGTVWANSLLFSTACSAGASVGIWEWGWESEKERECNRGRSRCTCVTRISIPTCRRPPTNPHQLSVIPHFSSSAVSISPLRRYEALSPRSGLFTSLHNLLGDGKQLA